jgi:hypothetical protein
MISIEAAQAEILRSDPYATGESVLERALRRQHDEAVTEDPAHAAWCAGGYAHLSPRVQHTCLAGPLCSYWYGASYPAPCLDQDGYALDSGVCPHASCNQVMDAMSCLACWTADETERQGT